MQPEATPDRRTVVALGAAALTGAAGLAACGSSDTSTSNSTTSSAATTGTAPSTTKGGSGSAKSIVKLADVPVGGAVAAQAPTGTVIVAQPTAGQVVAFSAVCTHQGCKVHPAGATLNCPCHGSKFDALTGKVLNGPARADLQKVPVKVNGQDVVAG